MATYNISLNKELADLVDKQVKKGKYANRSEFFRQMLRFIFLSRESSFSDWVYSEPYIGELKTRINRLKNGKEKIINENQFDKEFKL